MLTWEKIPGSPRFSVLQVTESWVGAGNEARATVATFPGPAQLSVAISKLGSSSATAATEPQ